MADTPEETEAGELGGVAPIVVVDLGKQKPKRVKRLRKGKGKLLAEVTETLEELKESGVVAADAQTVVVVVERRVEPFLRL